MKKILFTLGVISLLGVGLVGSCGWSGYKFASDFLHNELKIENWNLKIFRWCFNGLPFVDKLDALLDNKTYLVLLQNNRELRPLGGFMGSYAVLSTQGSGLREVEIQDIYVPDGQIVGHVDPPVPIQQAFGQGEWRLRDSNWDPDFTVAAPQIAWFFNQGGEDVDGLVAVNLSLVTSLLSVLGETKATDYPETVSAETFYDLAQKYAEVGFFPGSTQKRDFLGAVGGALFNRIKQINLIDLIKLINLIYRELKRGEILVWFKDTTLQQVIAQRNWDGGLGDYSQDYLYIVETNLGANKANCCVTREVIQTVNSLSTSLRIDYKNTNPFSNPVPPAIWGGDYVNYLRVVVPAQAQVQKVTVGGKNLIQQDLDWQFGLQEDRYQVEERGKFKIVGFWVVVPAGSQLTTEVQYTYGRLEKGLVVKKQPGVESFGYRLVVDGKVIASDTIDRDRKYSWTR